LLKLLKTIFRRGDHTGCKKNNNNGYSTVYIETLRYTVSAKRRKKSDAEKFRTRSWNQTHVYGLTYDFLITGRSTRFASLHRLFLYARANIAHGTRKMDKTRLSSDKTRLSSDMTQLRQDSAHTSQGSAQTRFNLHKAPFPSNSFVILTLDAKTESSWA
jgi:hypothetical protein